MAVATAAALHALDPLVLGDDALNLKQ